MGMDWHSSGITTSVLGALKRGLNPRAGEFGIYVCGGRGRNSRRTPDELRLVGDRTGLDGDALAALSRLTARIDNNAIADGFQLYLHSFVVSSAGDWTVVQQGMNPVSALARRYHWHFAAVRDFSVGPHTWIVGEPQGTIMNLVDRNAKPAQDAILTTVREHPERTLRDARRLVMPSHHDVRTANVDLKRLGALLAVAYDHEFRDFACRGDSRCKTASEARTILNERLGDVSKGVTPIAVSKVRLKELYEDMVADYRNKDQRLLHLERPWKHIESFFGPDCLAKAITDLRMQRFIDSRREQGAAQRRS